MEKFGDIALKTELNGIMAKKLQAMILFFTIETVQNQDVRSSLFQNWQE